MLLNTWIIQRVEKFAICCGASLTSGVCRYRNQTRQILFVKIKEPPRTDGLNHCWRTQELDVDDLPGRRISIARQASHPLQTIPKHNSITPPPPVLDSLFQPPREETLGVAVYQFNTPRALVFIPPPPLDTPVLRRYSNKFPHSITPPPPPPPDLHSFGPLPVRRLSLGSPLCMNQFNSPPTLTVVFIPRPAFDIDNSGSIPVLGSHSIPKQHYPPSPGNSTLCFSPPAGRHSRRLGVAAVYQFKTRRTLVFIPALRSGQLRQHSGPVLRRHSIPPNSITPPPPRAGDSIVLVAIDRLVILFHSWPGLVGDRSSSGDWD